MHRSPTFPEPQFKSGRVEVVGGSRVSCAIQLESDTHALLQFERPVIFTVELKLFFDSLEPPLLCAGVWRKSRQLRVALI